MNADDLLAFAENWPAEARAEAAEALQAIRNGERRAWYCTSPGRKCNDKPHAGYPYPTPAATSGPLPEPTGAGGS